MLIDSCKHIVSPKLLIPISMPTLNSGHSRLQTENISSTRTKRSVSTCAHCSCTSLRTGHEIYVAMQRNDTPYIKSALRKNYMQVRPWHWFRSASPAVCTILNTVFDPHFSFHGSFPLLISSILSRNKTKKRIAAS